ncbi:hypothetical protein [Phycicoccus sonneratiae]|uniref:Uncharacterized protein n=1 Tax=Phycicoccus sonneratiae TaxID=2807628 RepID=A0ABS2CN63_9MICO|nr:hypothetical protein [Phycicoccus sonneraticus]MBM6400509.1 hypothetical protein [Phycicoccus sonneraticus]
MPGRAHDPVPGDLTLRPLDYPLAPVPGPRLLVDGQAHTLRPHRRTALARLLAEHGAAPLSERTPVLAVGSNAAAEVLAHKLGRHGAPGVVPLLTGVVGHLGVAHTAYVSRGGYLPATPVHRTGRRTAVVLQLLDDAQLAAVDATEPGYERVELEARHYPLLVAGGFRPRRFHVYAARDGVLHLPGTGRGLHSQVEVLARLRRLGVPHTDHEDPAGVAEALTSPEARAAVRRHLAEAGHARPLGLRARPAGPLRWPEAVSAPRAARRARRPRRRRTGPR